MISSAENKGYTVCQFVGNNSLSILAISVSILFYFICKINIKDNFYTFLNFFKLVNENVIVISEASNHCRISAFSCVNKVFDFIREKHNLPLKVNLHVWSDGCAGQFCSKYVFALLSGMDRSVKLRWYYNERHHGKVSAGQSRIEFIEI